MGLRKIYLLVFWAHLCFTKNAKFHVCGGGGGVATRAIHEIFKFISCIVFTCLNNWMKSTNFEYIWQFMFKSLNFTSSPNCSRKFLINQIVSRKKIRTTLIDQSEQDCNKVVQTTVHLYTHRPNYVSACCITMKILEVVNNVEGLGSSTVILFLPDKHTSTK